MFGSAQAITQPSGTSLDTRLELIKKKVLFHIHSLAPGGEGVFVCVFPRDVLLDACETSGTALIKTHMLWIHTDAPQWYT